jgi:hypothetical protein
MGKYGNGIKDYEKGREYSREIHDQMKTVNNAIRCLRSQGCSDITDLGTLAPGTTPEKEDVLDLKEDLDFTVDHLYAHHSEKERIIKHFLKAQQLCLDCLEEVYEE